MTNNNTKYIMLINNKIEHQYRIKTFIDQPCGQPCTGDDKFIPSGR